MSETKIVSEGGRRSFDVATNTNGGAPTDMSFTIVVYGL